MVRSKVNSSEKSDADVLRAGDIVPPYKKKGSQKEDSRQAKGSSRSVSLSQQKREIPRFDLAEEILAEQRRITAVRRKAPSPIHQAEASKKSEFSSKKQIVESIGHAIEQSTQVLPEQQIIAEIVARDIAKKLKAQS